MSQDEAADSFELEIQRRLAIAKQRSQVAKQPRARKTKQPPPQEDDDGEPVPEPKPKAARKPRAKKAPAPVDPPDNIDVPLQRADPPPPAEYRNGIDLEEKLSKLSIEMDAMKAADEVRRLLEASRPAPVPKPKPTRQTRKKVVIQPIAEVVDDDDDDEESDEQPPPPPAAPKKRAPRRSKGPRHETEPQQETEPMPIPQYVAMHDALFPGR